MSARLLVIAIDGAESSLIENGAAAGNLPAFAAIRNKAATWSLERDNPMNTLPGALWIEAATGQSCARFGIYQVPRQLRTGEVLRRPIRPDEIPIEHAFWSIAGAAGQRTAVLDVPYSVVNPKLDGLQLIEWGMHDSEFGGASKPQELFDRVCARHGAHPVTKKAFGRCDNYRRTEAGYDDLLQDLLSGIRQRAAIYSDALAQQDWDLFVCGLTELHCVGHHFWHFHDPKHYLHDPKAPARFKSAVKTVYAAADEAIGKVVAAAGPDAKIAVFAPQGMRVLTGGAQLIEEVVARLGLGSGGDEGKHSLLRRVQLLVKRNAPHGLYPFLRRVGHLGALRWIQGRTGALLDPFESPKTRAGSVQNNAIGAVRLNLRGRDKCGCVEPGPEADAIVAMVRREFLALTDPKTGERIVKRVVTADELYGPDRHADLPDVMIEFRDDIGRIEACSSPRIGEVVLPIGKIWSERTGDHNDHSLLWMTGGDVARPGPRGKARVIDIAPAILRHTGIAVPAGLDGTPLRLN
jgi:predicted AlkP superfamily phosphohydrolase/phosphomutase